MTTLTRNGWLDTFNIVKYKNRNYYILETTNENKLFPKEYPETEIDQYNYIIHITTERYIFEIKSNKMYLKNLYTCDTYEEGYKWLGIEPKNTSAIWWHRSVFKNINLESKYTGTLTIGRYFCGTPNFNDYYRLEKHTDAGENFDEIIKLKFIDGKITKIKKIKVEILYYSFYSKSNKFYFSKYHPKLEKMEIKFREDDNKTYTYCSVPFEIFINLFKADNQGVCFNEVVDGNFRCPESEYLTNVNFLNDSDFNIGKYIRYFQNPIVDKLVVDESDNGTKHFPYIDYGPVVSTFIKEFHNSEYILNNYNELLEKNNIVLEDNLEINNLSLDICKALLTKVIRGEKFNTGYIKRNIDNGTILKLLKRINQVN